MIRDEVNLIQLQTNVQCLYITSLINAVRYGKFLSLVLTSSSGKSYFLKFVCFLFCLTNYFYLTITVDSDELDSYMYQTVGHHAIDLYAEAMALPLYRRTIRGRSLETGKMYTTCEGDEVEDLYELLKLVKVCTVTVLFELCNFHLLSYLILNTLKIFFERIFYLLGRS